MWSLVTASPTAVAASAAIAAPATTVSAAAAAIAATTTTTTTASGWTSFARPRFVNGQGATFDGLPIELGNRVLRVLFRSHRHKRKSTRLAGEFVLHEGDFLHGTGL